MAANLVRRYPPDVAHHLLNLSFAQYRADSDVVRLEAQLERTRDAIAEAEAAAQCQRGDIKEYQALVGATEETGHHRHAFRGDVVAALDRVKPGDVLVVPGGKSGGRVAVLSTSRRRGGDMRLRAITTDRRVLSLGPKDFPAPPRPVARVELPAPYAPNNAGFQRQAASALQGGPAAEDGQVGLYGPGSSTSPGSSRGESRGRETMVRAEAAAAHPVAGCADLRRHLRAAERADRLARDGDSVPERRIWGRTESLARQFDRVLRVLEAWGYVDGWALTPAGERLVRTYHEADLLVAESLQQGLLDGLSPAEVAAVASVFTFEARGQGEGSAGFATAAARQRWEAVEGLAAELNSAVVVAGLPLTRPPDPGFMALAYGWAAGRDLEALIDEAEISGGDFVRNVKQLVGLCCASWARCPRSRDRSGRLPGRRPIGCSGVVAASAAVSVGPVEAAGEDDDEVEAADEDEDEAAGDDEVEGADEDEGTHLETGSRAH